MNRPVKGKGRMVVHTHTHAQITTPLGLREREVISGDESLDNESGI